MFGMGLALMNPTKSFSGGDPYFSLVTSLLHANGVDGGTAFTDEKGITWTNNGNVQTKTDIVKFGTAAAKFNGSNYLSTPVGSGGSAVFDFSVDFTLGFWVYLEQNPATARPSLYTSDGQGGVHVGHFMAFNTSGKLRVGLCYNSDPTTFLTLIGSTTVSQNNWHYVELDKSGNNVYLFLNGNLEASATGVAAIKTAQARNFFLGQYYDGALRLTGRLDDFEFTKGVARNTSAFTPPTYQAPDS